MSNYYQERINKAVAYINEHLAEDVKISELAKEASFSLFHFQRIYKAMQGETPYETLQRLRLEKSVFLLKYHSELKISDVAFKCGFPSNENFSRQFKKRYRMSPTSFRSDKSLHNSRIYQEKQPNDYYHYIEESRLKEKTDFDVCIEELEVIPIAFVRGIFGSDGSVLVERYLELIAWAEKQKVAYQGELMRFGMSIDNPEVTPIGKYRYDFAVRTNTDFEESGIIEFGEIPAGEYATLHCRGDIHEVAKAWDYLYRIWLPTSDYIPLHKPAVEEFIQGPEEIGWTNFNIKCRIPITRIVTH